MDQNGESDTNSMVLDPVSPGSNNSRDMLDEPAAPRRNSTDDNDTTRPRKRPAVMAGSEEQRENLAISPQLRHSDASDGSEPRLPVVESSTKSTTESTLEAVPEASRTIQIRAPQAQTGNGEMQDIPVEPDFKSHDALKRTLSQSPELPHSDGDSDSHTLRSTSPEVEEVEMDVNEDLSYHIKQMDPGTDSSDFIDDSEDPGDVLNRIATAFEKSECPIRELEEISIAISRFVSAVNVDPSRFEHLFLGQSELCESLPTLVENLLTRETPFDAVFYERDGLRHITQFFANFVRLAALIIQYEASKLATIPVEEEIQLFAEAYLATINSMLRSGHLYVIINHAGFHITDTFPDVIRSFVGPEGFLASFKSLAAIVYERIPSQPRQPSLVEHLGSVALQILKTLQMATAADIKNKILRHITEYWAILEAALSDILESHVQAVDIKEFLGRLEDFSSLAAQIHHLQPTNPKLSSKLRECLSNSNSYMEPKAKSLMLVVEWAHKFPFYYKMLCTSRMDIRLRGLVAMTDTLLAVWKEYHVRTWEDAPILRFLVTFLIENRVLEYIVGPESHSELIYRSGNVPAFLVVNRRITEDLLDCLWQPVVDNKDPRIVKATLKMHQDMLSVMNQDLLCSISRRISCLPFTSFDSGMMSFVGYLGDRIRKCYASDPRQRAETEMVRLGPDPYEMLIRLMRLASEHDENAQALGIFDRVNEELTGLAEFGPEGNVRRRILDRCVDDIRAMNGSATGSTSVILAFLRRRPRNLRADSPTAPEDVEYLVDKFDLAALLVSELVGFVEGHRSVETIPRTRKLKLRLELLTLMLLLSPKCLSKELHAQLWLYLVGEKALGSSERDVGCEFYNLFSSPDEPHPLLDIVYREFFPALDCAYFSPSVLDLCKKSLEYLNRITQPETLMDEDDAKVIEIAGVEQLWRIILDSNDEKLAASTIAFLVNVYLDSSIIIRCPSHVVEATHVAIVNRCIELLTSTGERLSKLGSGDGDEMSLDGLLSDEIHQITRKYHRTLDLLDEFVRGFRSRPYYVSGNQGETSPLKGEPLDITLRLCVTGIQTVHPIQIGSLNTAYDLHCQVYRITAAKHRVILSGRELKLADEPSKTLKDLGVRHKSDVVIYLTGTNAAQAIANHTGGPAQPDIMRHFEALYTLLELPELLSVKAWSFLNNFSPNDLVKRQLLDPHTPSVEILPPDKPYKSLYSLFALRHCFEEQKAVQDDMMPFLRTCVSRLCEALTGGAIEHPNQTFKTRVAVAKELLERLKVILQEPIPQGMCMDLLPHPDVFVKCLFSIIWTCMDSTYADLAGVDVCNINAIQVLFESCRISPQVWLQCLQGSDIKKLVFRALVGDLRSVVRECLCEAISAICTQPSRSETSPQEFAEYFWPILSDILACRDRLTPENSEQLFRAAAVAFEFLGISGCQSLDLEVLFDGWFNELRSRQVAEVIGQPMEDNVVLGFTRLLGLCINFMRRRGLTPGTEHLEDTWQNLLFPDAHTTGTGVERIPCLHDTTRAELYKLTLKLVISHQESLDQIIVLNNALFPDDGILVDEYWVDRDRWLRAPTGLVGVHNLSNTCYLNSLLTQLFMNQSFRDFTLRLPVESSDKECRSSFCLKALFARMQIGFARAIEPRDLVESLRDFAGDPIDPHVQMDVDEFFNLLFDRLESEMPSSQLKSSFRSYYGGHLVQQVKSNECSHISERTEPFSAIQCDIKGKHTLQESLKAYVEGEIMEGDNKYRCTTCDRLVDAVKRTCLKDIPDHFICHLKRFDFDLQTMHRSKINDRFEFPTKLDMKPYTIDYLSSVESGIDRSSDTDEFELVGVLVHTGTAESGHYYSYIRNRLSHAENPSWFEFNDSEVSLFDPSTIPENCYGGSDGVSATGYVLPKSFSAYMLFYQRSSSLPKCGSSQLPESSIPSVLRMEILKENEDLIQRHSMFSSDYVAFVKELVDARSRVPPDLSEGESDLEVLNLAQRVFEQICTRVKDFPGWESLAASMEGFACRTEECSKAFLEWISETHIIHSLILDNPFMAIRSYVTKMILSVLGHLRRTNWILYGIPDDDDSSAISREQTMLYTVCKGFSDAWLGLQQGVKPWNDYFGFLVDLCLRGDYEKDYLLKVGILRKLLEMILIDHLGSSKRAELRVENFVKIMSKQRLPAARPAELLCQLMKRCSPFMRPCKSDEARERRIAESPLPLTQIEDYYFKWSPPRIPPALVVYTKLLELSGTQSAMEKMTADMLRAPSAPAEHGFIEEVKNTLLNSISVDPAVHATPYLQCLLAFVAATKSQVYISEIIAKVAEEIPTIGLTGGMEHLRFFQNLWPLHAPGRSVKPPIIESIRFWAPALIVYHDPNVRDSVEDFLDQIIFEEPLSETDIIRRAVMELANGLFQFIVNKFPHNRQPLDETTFSATWRILTRCKDSQLDETQYNDRLDELKTFIDHLGLGLEDEDADDVASDDWGCSEIGSDTRDVAHTEELR